jgi:kinesin family protein C1
MEGGLSESTKGMIPRAVEQVFQVAEVMKKKGWEYKLEGQFLEIVSLILFLGRPLLIGIVV